MASIAAIQPRVRFNPTYTAWRPVVFSVAMRNSRAVVLLGGAAPYPVYGLKTHPSVPATLYRFSLRGGFMTARRADAAPGTAVTALAANRGPH